MAKGDFINMNPKARVDLFGLYVDVNSKMELQGRGIASWTIDQNQDINQEADVLGYVDNTRGTAKPTQAVDTFYLRKDSELGKMFFNAWFNNDMTALDALTFYQKFKFMEGSTPDKCLARKCPNTMVSIESFNGEAENYLSFSVTFYYSGEIETGEMSIEDGATPSFAPDASGASLYNEE